MAEPTQQEFSDALAEATQELQVLNLSHSLPRLASATLSYESQL